MNFVKGFNGLRAISILFVLTTHLGFFALLPKGSFLAENYYLISGQTGVLIFFTISGFLITLLLLNEKKRNGKIDIKKFFVRRFLRLMPPLIIFFILIFIMMSFGLISKSYFALIMAFFYCYNFVPIQYYVVELGHTWSLAIEEQFYFLWPFVMTKVSKLRVVLSIVLILALVCVIIKILIAIGLNDIPTLHILSESFFIERWFIPACLPIMVGVLVALFVFYFDDKLSKRVILKPTYLVTFFILYLSQIIIPEDFEIFSDIGLSVSVGFLLIWIYYNQDSLMVKFLEFAPLAFIGKISYGLYVYQGFFLRTGPGGKLTFQKFPLNLIALIILTLLSYYFVEKKILNYKSKFVAI